MVEAEWIHSSWISFDFSRMMGSMEGVARTGRIFSASMDAAYSQFTTYWQFLSALKNFASSLCSSSKSRILLTAVTMRSGIDEPPSLIRAEARKSGTGVHILNFLRAVLIITDRLATPSESLRDLKADQSGSWHSVSSKRCYLLICAGKTWEVVPERMKSL